MPFVKPQKSFILKILTRQYVLFNILCDTTEVQVYSLGVQFRSTPSTVLLEGDGCFKEKHLHDWAVRWLRFFLRGRASFFFLGKTDKQWLFRLGDLACSQKWKKWNSHCKKNWQCLSPVVKFDLSSQNWILENLYLASWASQHFNY